MNIILVALLGVFCGLFFMNEGYNKAREEYERIPCLSNPVDSWSYIDIQDILDEKGETELIKSLSGHVQTDSKGRKFFVPSSCYLEEKDGFAILWRKDIN